MRGADSAEVVESGLHRVRLRVRMPCGGTVVLAANGYPGWEAMVDGRSAPVLAAEVALRAVALEAGGHEVEFRYRPKLLYVGLGLTVVGLAAALAWGRRGS